MRRDVPRTARRRPHDATRARDVRRRGRRRGARRAERVVVAARAGVGCDGAFAVRANESDDGRRRAGVRAAGRVDARERERDERVDGGRWWATVVGGVRWSVGGGAGDDDVAVRFERAGVDAVRARREVVAVRLVIRRGRVERVRGVRVVADVVRAVYGDGARGEVRRRLRFRLYADARGFWEQSFRWTVNAAIESVRRVHESTGAIFEPIRLIWCVDVGAIADGVRRDGVADESVWCSGGGLESFRRDDFGDRFDAGVWRWYFWRADDTHE